MSKEAMKLALDALQRIKEADSHYATPKQVCDARALYEPTIKALEEALAQPQPKREPLTDEQQKNAARYQWLRNPTIDVSLVLDKRTKWVEPDENVSGVGGYWIYEYRAGEELDAAIDTAIEAAHGIKE